MLKTVLIRPPRPKGDPKFVSLQFPLNLGYIASYLQAQGHSVELWDYEVEDLTEEQLCRRVRKAKPVLIGFSCLTPTIIGAHNIASTIKKRFPRIIIAAGGAHPTALPEQTLKEFANFDLVVVGEGEKTLEEVLLRLAEGRPAEGVQGLAYRTHDGAVKIEDPRPVLEDLDTLPFPARNLINQDLYRSHHVSRAFSRQFLKVAEIMATRGCPYECIFCATHYRQVHFRSVENVLAEVEQCIEKHQTTHFSFLDETITLKPEYILELCQGLRGFKGISWDCFARVNTVTPEVVKEMAGCGCQKISYGVESGSPRILELLKKRITVEQVKQAFHWSRQAGIRYVEGSFMVGAHPAETKQDIELTRKLIFEIDPDILMLAIMVPYPGARVYQLMQDQGYLDQQISWDDFVFFSYRPAWRTEHFTGSELVDIHRQMLRQFYLRPKYIFKTLKKLRSWGELQYWLGEGLDFITKTRQKCR